MRSKWDIAFNFIFVVRRMLFCITIFAIEDPVLQLISIFFINKFAACYIAYFQPKLEVGHVTSKFKNIMNRLEMFNEVMIYIITLHLIVFSDMVSDVHVKFNAGYSQVSCVILLEAVNILLIAYHVVR